MICFWEIHRYITNSSFVIWIYFKILNSLYNRQIVIVVSILILILIESNLQAQQSQMSPAIMLTIDHRMIYKLWAHSPKLFKNIFVHDVFLNFRTMNTFFKYRCPIKISSMRRHGYLEIKTYQKGGNSVTWYQ